MKIPRVVAIYFSLTSLVALSIIGFILLIYKHVLSTLPAYSELEIPFYYFFLASLFIYNLILYWKFKIGDIKKISLKTITIPLFTLLAPLIIGLVYVNYFITVQFWDSTFIQNLHDAGIIAQDYVALPLLGAIFLFYTIFFLWLVLKKNYTSRSGILFYIFLLAITVGLAFNYGYLNTYDYSYVAGPVNDVLHGKYLLINAPSQYGFFSILFLSIIFKFFPLGLANIVLTNAILVTLQFIVLGICLLTMIKNKWLAILALVTAIFANYIIEIFPPGAFPQTNAWRFGIWTVILFLILLQEKGNFFIKRIVRFSLPLLVGFFIFWEFDSGLYLLMAYSSLTLVINIRPSFKISILNILLPLIEILLSIIAIFLSINLIYLLILGKIPNWIFFIADPGYYLSSGFSFVPLQNTLWHEIIFATYLLNFLVLATRLKFYPEFSKNVANRMFIFTLFLGIFQLTYYMGRSHLNNLHHIIIPFIVCLFYDFDYLLQVIRNQKYLAWKVVGVSGIAIFLMLPSYFFFTQGLSNMLTPNFFSVQAGATELSASNFLNAIHNIGSRKKIEKATLDQTLGNSERLLRSKYGKYIAKNGITLVSWEDTWYLIDLGMKNNIDSNNLKYFIREDEVHALSKQIIDSKYQYVFIDVARPEGFVSVNEAAIIYKDLLPYYKLKESLDRLEVLELKN